MGEYIVEAKNLCKYFKAGKNQTLKAVDGVNIRLEKGETLGLVGESGCGKTTCGRTLVKLYDATSGTVLFEGKDVSKLKGKELLGVCFLKGRISRAQKRRCGCAKICRLSSRTRMHP